MEDTLVVRNLEIVVQNTLSSIQFVWKGEAEERNPGMAIRPFLDRVTADLETRKKKITVDLRQLEFMNSACIGLLTRFLKQMDDLNQEVEVHFNTKRTWQMLSKRCTSTIFRGKDNVKIIDSASNDA